MINFRDLGGMRTADGRVVAPGLLFRSSQWLDNEEHNHTKGIGRWFDLRAPFERERKPCLPPDGVKVFNLCEAPCPCAQLPPLKAGRILGRGKPGEEMLSRYTGFVTTQAKGMRRFLGLLLEEVGSGLFFCCQGKDRAGVFAAVLLQALGIAETDIMADYLLSNEALTELNKADFARLSADMSEPEKAVLRSYMEARPEYLRAFLKAQGDFENFWRNALGFSASQQKQLRDMYLI